MYQNWFIDTSTAESCKVLTKTFLELLGSNVIKNSPRNLKLKGYPTNRILNLLSKVIFAVCYRLYYFDSLKVVKFVEKTVPGKIMENLQKSSKKQVMYFRDPHWRQHLKRMESCEASSLQLHKTLQCAVQLFWRYTLRQGICHKRKKHDNRTHLISIRTLDTTCTASSVRYSSLNTFVSKRNPSFLKP